MKWAWCFFFHRKHHKRRNVRVLRLHVAYDYTCDKCALEGVDMELSTWKL